FASRGPQADDRVFPLRCGAVRLLKKICKDEKTHWIWNMLMFISVSLMALACILAIPVTILLMEVLAALTLSPRRGAVPIGNGCHPRVAVLVPAHNESIGLLPTLMDIKAQTRAPDRLIVVADNCVDDTGSVAASVGAEVVDRNDPDRKGKGYALA